MPIQWSEYPTLENIYAINPSIELPKTYKGKNVDADLANAFVNTLTRRTFQEITETESLENFPKSTPAEKRYLRDFPRYAVSLNDETIYWDYLNILRSNKLTVSDVSYLILLTSKWSGEELQQVLATLMAIHNYQRSTKEADSSIAIETAKPSITQIEEIFKLGLILRGEGVVMSAQYLWIAADKWKPEEVLELLEEGLPIIKALQLYQLGFNSIQEMVEYDDMIPESWIERIFSEKNDPDGAELYGVL